MGTEEGSVGAVVVGWLLTEISAVWPFCLPMVLLAVGYLAAGNLIRKKEWLSGKLPAWSWVLLAVICLSCFAFGEVNMVACRWKLGLWDVAGSFCVGFLLLRGYRWLMEQNWRGVPAKFLESIGLNSLWIVFLHGFEKVIFPWYRLGSLLPQSPVLCVVLCLVLRSILIFVLLRLIMWVRRKLQKKRGKPGITLQ